MNYDKIGEFIKIKRKEKNLTQNELATRIGVTNKAISKWECGLGCPDISLLEVLSKELDVSILELLKGNNIDEDIIELKSSNEYIKESLQYSKNQTKKKVISTINIIIESIIVVICILLVILNVYGFFNMSKKYNYEISNDLFERKDKELLDLEKNINIIKDNKGIYETDDYNKLVEYLNGSYNTIKNYTMLSKRKKYLLTQNEMYLILLEYEKPLNEWAILQILEKYNEDIKLYKDLLVSIKLNYGVAADYNFPIKSYKYNINIIKSQYEKEIFYTDELQILSLFNNARYEMLNLTYITKLIIETGDINE